MDGRTTDGRRAFWRKTLTDLAIMTVVGVFLAVIGPFGSIEEPLALRLVTWLAFSYAGYMLYSPMGFFVERAHRSLDLPLAPLWFFAALVASIPMTALVYIVQYIPDWPPVPPLEEALTSYFYVFVIGGAITLLFNVIALRGDAPPVPESEPEKGIDDRVDAAMEQERLPPDVEGSGADNPEPEAADAKPANPLFDQLPPALGSDIIALEMQDHYVCVHTALGSEMVLMRLRDAMVHVEDIEGRQVHRSWWVARGAVEDVLREGRNVRLKLARDIEAPVSRAQVSELRDAGWI